jgi:hypothetical protein
MKKTNNKLDINLKDLNVMDIAKNIINELNKLLKYDENSDIFLNYKEGI